MANRSRIKVFFTDSKEAADALKSERAAYYKASTSTSEHQFRSWFNEAYGRWTLEVYLVH